MNIIYQIWRIGLKNDLRTLIYSPQKKRMTGLMSQLILPIFLSLSLTVSLFQTTQLFHFTFYILSFSMLMTAFSIMIELSTRIMQPQDIEIWLAHPVPVRSLYLAKFGQILTIVLILTSITISIPSILSSLRTDTTFWFPLILFITALIANGFIAALLVIFYTSLSRILSVRRGKNIISIMQLLAALLLIGIHQWSSYIPQWNTLNDALRQQFILYLLPPTWFVIIVEFLSGSWHGHIILPAAAIIVSFILWPVVLMRIPIHYLKLSEHQGTGGSSSQKSRFFLLNMMDKMHISSELKSGFLLSWRLLGRDRSIYMPFLAMMSLPIMLLVFQLSEGRSLSLRPDPGISVWETTYSMLMIAIFFVMYFAHHGLRFAKDYSASWTYRTASLKRWDRFYRGIRMALIIRFLFPLFMIICIIHLIQLDCAQAILQTCLLFILGLTAFSWFSVLFPRLPFSQKRMHRSGQTWPKFFIAVIPLIISELLYNHIIITWKEFTGYTALLSIAILIMIDFLGGKRINNQLLKQMEHTHD